MSDFPRTAFLGAGQIAEALTRGVLAAGLITPDRIIASDVRPERLDFLVEALGIRTTTDNLTAVRSAEIVFLTVKPQDIDTVLADVGMHIEPAHTVVSVAAGVPIRRIEAALRGHVPVVRVMPNTPCLVGEGMAVVALGSYASETHEELVLRIFRAVGRAITLPEKHLDAVTALSGSGPAFVSLIIEAFSDAGVRVGLPRDVAQLLSIQTVLGTARMLRETGAHPALMKEMVTSPGGTSIAGLHALERGGVRAAIMDAVVAAAERSRELGQAPLPEAAKQRGTLA